MWLGVGTRRAVRLALFLHPLSCLTRNAYQNLCEIRKGHEKQIYEYHSFFLFTIHLIGFTYITICNMYLFNTARFNL